MRKFIISENTFRAILSEMAYERGLLNEISTADAYNRFYKDRIPQEVYSELMSGTEKMTPFHKACLDALLYDHEENNLDVAKRIGKSWAMCSQDARQLVINTIGSWIGSKPSILSLARLVEKMPIKKGHTENNYAQRGLHVVFENEGLLVTCTTSYSASKKFYGDSHWCTASDVTGENNGFDMFKEYTTEDDSILLQFIDKQNRENSYQCQYSDWKSGGQICDFMDKNKKLPDLMAMVSEKGANLEEIFHNIDYSGLLDETEYMIDEEGDYWEQKYDAYLKKLITNMKKNFRTKQYDEMLINGVLKMLNGDDAKVGGLFHSDRWLGDFDMHVSILKNDKHPEMVIANVDYYGGMEGYSKINDLEDRTDGQSYHPFETVIMTVSENGVKINKRYNSAYTKKYVNIFVMDMNETNYILNSDLNVIAEGEFYTTGRKYLVIGPKSSFLAGYEDEYKKRTFLVDKTSGEVVSDLVQSVSIGEGLCYVNGCPVRL